MTNKRNAFDEALNAVSETAGDYLVEAERIAQRKHRKTSSAPENVVLLPEANVGEVGEPKPQKPQTAVGSRDEAPEAAPRVNVEKVTFDIPAEEKRILEQAANWNAAFGIEPSTQKDILLMALRDWNRKHGFPKRAA